MNDTAPTQDLAQRWRAGVERELARAPDPAAAFARLTTRLPDGLALAPLYTEAPPGPPATRVSPEPRLVSWPALPTPDDLDLRPLEQRGAAPAEELATALVALFERPHIPLIHLGLSPDVLMQVAKLRALRRLALRLSELDAHPRPFVLHTHTSVRHFTRHDPWVNQLRNTAAVFAAILGGAGLITPVPWDAPLGAPSDEARRLADHTVNIALHESQLAADDPAFGSFALEQLTDDLCQLAWALAADPAALAARIEATTAERARRVARRDFGGAFVGATLYPDLDEPRPERPPATHPLGPRLAEPFEHLREGATAMDARVFLATFGPLARHTARTTWVTQLLAAGGLRPVDPSPAEGYEDPGALGAAFAASGLRLAILSVADTDWGEGGTTLLALARELASHGATVLVAGRPTPALQAEPSVAGFIHAGLVALDVLVDLHRRLGLPTEVTP